MADGLVFIAWMVASILGPLGWRVLRDRAARRGLVLRADIDAALRRALGGESLVSIEVIASAVWRRGRVVLSVPAGWGCLVKAAWDHVVDALPADYDLVIRGVHRIGQAKQPVKMGSA